jgi:uncharacterized membrane protein
VDTAQDSVREAVDWIVLVIESLGALIIAIGVLIALVLLARALLRPTEPASFTRVRLVLGSYLVLGLEFQLAADILKTAVAPTFTEIGQLAAIAAIRTLLNYFLTKEIQSERAELAERGEDMPPLPTPRH